MLIKISQYEERRQELIAIESQLRSKMLIHQPTVQKFIKLAYGTCNMDVYDLAISRLNLILKFHATQEMRTPDEFRPHCPEQLSKTGQLHAIDQIDGLPIFIDHNKCVTGLGIFGPQGSGKSYVIVDVCSKIRQIDDSVKTLIIDAKGGFSDLKGYLHLDLREISFDLKPSDNAQLENFTNDFMPIFATDMGLIYSLDLLSQALDIALAQRKKIMDQTGMDPGLSLRDIFEALKTIKVHTFRKQGYYDAAFTALSLILGRTELFSCRHGVCLEWLFSKNVVLNARCLTHEFQCRFFIIFLLYWLYYKIRYVRGQNSLKQVIFIDGEHPFYVSKERITKEQYSKFLSDIYSENYKHSRCWEEVCQRNHVPKNDNFSPIKIDASVSSISWFDGYAFCKWLGPEFQLPTKKQYILMAEYNKKINESQSRSKNGKSIPLEDLFSGMKELTMNCYNRDNKNTKKLTDFQKVLLFTPMGSGDSILFDTCEKEDVSNIIGFRVVKAR